MLRKSSFHRAAKPTVTRPSHQQTGKHPGRTMVQSLHGFICSIALQHLRHASTLFFKLSCSLFFKLSCILPSIDHADQKNLSQLHQVFISCDMIECLHSDLSVSMQTLKEKLGPSCQAAFIGVPVHPSGSQQQVSDRLRGMGRSVEDEFRCPKVWLLH